MRFRWLPVTVWFLSLTGIIFIADTGHARAWFDFVNSIPLADKVCHAIGVGALAYWLERALGWRWIPAGCLVIAGVFTLEESSQLWIRTRNFDLADLVANYIGIVGAWRLALRSQLTR
jgi:hypothetical protein